MAFTTAPDPTLLTRPSPVPPIIAFPAGLRDEIVVHDVLETDERRWVPQAPGIAFLPLLFGVTQGYYVNLLRVRCSGVLSCHRHSGTVHAQVLRGAWYYREHDWVARAGSFVMEPPGETHTLVVPPEVEEMITWFHVSGGYTYYDAEGHVTGIEDVFTKLDKARAHYAAMGFSPAEIERLVR